MGGGILRDIDSREAGKAGSDAQPLPKPGDIFILHHSAFFILHDLTDCQGSGPDKAHLSPEDIDELRKLVQTHGAQDSAYLSDALVVFLSLPNAKFRIGVCHHGAKLICSEASSVPPPTFLTIKDRATIFQLYG